MPPEVLRQWLKAKPFRPFQVHVLGSAPLLVEHPDTLVLHIASFDFYELKEDASVTEFFLTMSVACRYVVKLTPVSLPPQVKLPSDTNGQK